MARIPVARPSLSGVEAALVSDAVTSGWISSVGRYVEEFEQRFAAFVGVRHAITCSNGTTALHLALAGLGVGPGDEVIVPTFTYIASANAARYCGADVILADVEPDTKTLDPRDVARRITDRTRAIVAVDLYGIPADYRRLREVIGGRPIALVEDAAEAHGARRPEGMTGSLGDVGTFSFFGNKILTTGEGGMVTTDDDVLAERCRLLRGQGMSPSRRYWFPIVGFNYRMTNVAAAIGVGQMSRLEGLLRRRDEIEVAYDELLAPLGDHLSRAKPPLGARTVNWMYTVYLAQGGEHRRDQIMAELDRAEVETRPAFIPLHLMPPYAAPADSFPVAERAGASGISLPTYSDLTDREIERVVASLRQAIEATAPVAA